MKSFEWPVRPGDVLAWTKSNGETVALFVVYVNEVNTNYQNFDALSGVHAGITKWSCWAAMVLPTSHVSWFQTLSRTEDEVVRMAR